MAGAPIMFTAAGQRYEAAGTIIALVWEGETTVGDRAELTLIGSDAPVWSPRTELSQTYCMLSLAPNGIEAPRGFTAAALTAGRLFVYLK